MNIPNHVFADFVATLPTVPSPSSSVAWMNVPLGLPTVHEHPHICSAFVPFLRKWRIIQILTENQNDTTACLPSPPTPCTMQIVPPWVFLHSPALLLLHGRPPAPPSATAPGSSATGGSGQSLAPAPQWPVLP